MIISANGKEIEIKPLSEDKWLFRSVNRNNFSACNSSALSIAIPTALAPKSNRRDCVRGYAWQCPFAHYPCTSRYKRDNKHLAAIEYTNFERRKGHRRNQNGQLQLWQQGYWYNVKTDEERWTNEARPYQTADIVCKQFAVASMEFMKRHGFENVLKWRILPIDDDLEWTNNQQKKHKGRYSSCVFDSWD